jgi:tRNA A37 methylthiotransferase MiaB
MFKRHGTVTNLALVERYLIKTVGTDAVVGFGGETEAAFQQPVR